MNSQMSQGRKRNQQVVSGQRVNKNNNQTPIIQENIDTYLDLRQLDLPEFRKSRPLLLSPNLTIIVEKFNNLYGLAYEFLISIAEPINRSNYIHEYQITQMSLYTAMVLQYSSDDIIQVLNLLSKNQPPAQMQSYIRKHTLNMGKAKFYLHENFYWIELDEDVCEMVFNEVERLLKLVQLPIELKDFIFEVEHIVIQIETNSALDLIISQLDHIDGIQKVNQDELNQLAQSVDNIQNNDQIQSDVKRATFRKFKILGDYFVLTEALINTYVPLIQEFDYKQLIVPLDINLKNVKPRIYQQRTLKNFIIKDKARSGIVVLPCGAGKTIVGIMCIEQMKCSTIIICDSNVSVDQWRKELEKCTTINSRKIVRITGYVKDKWEGEMPVIVLSTYSWLIAQMTLNRSISPSWAMIKSQEWGLCIVDEVHRLPALQFCNVLRAIKCAVKLGLTATLLREDDKLDNLYFMIGPKLYEENLLDLMSLGHLAKPYIVEILCEMTPIFKKEYNQRGGQLRTLLHTGNPNKYAALQFLIKQHERLGHKIIVFCDSLLILNHYANLLGYPVIDGDLNTDEKNKIFNLFKTSNEIRTIFVSRVGDTGIDIPQASVGIEIGYLGGSRRQKVQRLGRVMRPKLDQESEISAFFYSLASKDTVESEYSYKRQKYITEQLGINTELINEADLPYVQNPAKYGIKQLNELGLLEEILLCAKNVRQQEINTIDEEQEDIKIVTDTRTFTDQLTGIYRLYNQ